MTRTTLFASLVAMMAVASTVAHGTLSPLFPSVWNQPRHFPGMKDYVLTERYSGPRQLQANSGATAGEECLDAPYLWLIRSDNDNNEVKGLGVGTMHLPRQFVLTESEWQSLVNAVEDACTVYAEVDLTDPTLLEAVVTSCANTREPVFVADLPDPALRATLEEIVMDIVTEYTLFPQRVAESLLLFNPVDLIFQLVAYWNSDAAVRDDFFESLLNGEATLDFLDTNLLDLGQPSASLETVEESCALLDSLAMPTKQNFLDNFDELYAEKAWARLNVSLDFQIEQYNCGREEGLEEMFIGSLETETWGDLNETLIAILDGKSNVFCLAYSLYVHFTSSLVFCGAVRNIAMAERMVTAMEESDNLPLFAVGLAHWTIGENSFVNLLQQQGYSLERIEVPYDSSLIPDAVCGESAGEPSEDPVAGTDEPMEPLEDPVAGTDEPMEPSEDPVDGIDEPVEPTSSPSGGSKVLTIMSMMASSATIGLFPVFF